MMETRLARICRAASPILILLVSTVHAKDEVAESRPATGEAAYRAGWIAFVAPSLDPKTVDSVEARQRARAVAIGQFERAVAASPRNVSYQASLTYVCLAAAKYQEAKTAIDLAIETERKDPLLYLMRGQAEAALAQMDPATASKNIGPAIAAFDHAAQLDPKNSLPLLQATSVAFDVDRLDLATPRLKQALERPECRLYRLPVPTDLSAEQGNAFQIWEQIQLSYWFQLLSRCQNVTNSVGRLGAQEERLGNTDTAEGYFRQVYDVARQVGRIEPHLFITLGTAIDILERAYPALARVAKARNDPRSEEQWNGELGVLQIGRAELKGAIQDYFVAMKDKPPSTVDEMLWMEAEYVGRTFRGIGLGSFSPEDPKREAKPSSEQTSPVGPRS